MNIISNLLSNLNYGTILLLMLLESTVIPFLRNWWWHRQPIMLRAAI